MTTLYDVMVYTPKTLKEALKLLADKKGIARPIAGGTDLIIQMKNGVLYCPELINIYGLDELRYIRLEDGRIRIGALTTFSEIAESPLIRGRAAPLAEAASTVGSAQIMNKATIGGNIVNASPAADSLPPLYVLEANVVLQGLKGSRAVPIERFYLGYKKMDMGPDELVTEVNFRAMDADEGGIFLKHGLRLGDAISVVNAAILVKRGPSRDELRGARIALGAVAPTVVRAREAEKVAVEGPLDEGRMWEIARAVTKSISPITDVRGSAEYRREMAVNLVYKGLWELVYGVGGSA